MEKLTKCFKKITHTFSSCTFLAKARNILIILPSLIYVSNYKETFEDSGKFGLNIRKHLRNSRIRKIEQREFERIIQLTLENKERVMNLYIELFKPGNIILTDDKNKIIMATTYKGFGSRMIRPGAVYEYPKRNYNFLKLKETELNELIKKSEKASIVITLATELGLGGKYAEELCEVAKIDKNKKTLDKKEITNLFKATEKLKKVKKTLNKELDEHHTEKSKTKIKQEKESKFDKKRKQLESIIKQQENKIKGLQISITENQKKAELIYEKYVIVNKLLEDLKRAREKMSWKEIKDKLKDHKIVKDIKENEKKLVLEL